MNGDIVKLIKIDKLFGGVVNGGPFNEASITAGAGTSYRTMEGKYSKYSDDERDLIEYLDPKLYPELYI